MFRRSGKRSQILPQQTFPLLSLPDGPLEGVLAALDDRDFASFRAVSRHCRSVAAQPQLNLRRVTSRYGLLGGWPDVAHLLATVRPPAGTSPLDGARWAALHRCPRMTLADGRLPLQVLVGHNPTKGQARSHHRAIELLLACGADPAAKGPRGHTALDLACRSGSDQAVHLLTQKAGGLRPSSLFQAIDRGLASAVPLLARLQEAERTNEVGETCLHRALWARKPGLVAPLVAAGVPVMARCSFAWNALEVAAHVGDLPSLHVLVAAGGDLNEACPLGFVPLHHAVINDNLELVRHLVEDMGASLDPPTRGPSTLGLACEFASLRTAVYLIDVGRLRVNQRDGEGWTPLLLAAKQAPRALRWRDTEVRYADTIRLLLGHGARRRRLAPGGASFQELLNREPTLY